MRRTCLAVLAAVSLASPLEAAPPGHAAGGPPPHAARERAAVPLQLRFSEFEIRLIQDFYRGQPTAIRTLPPGIRYQVARGRPVPPGLRQQALPPELLRTLPRRDGVNRIVIGRDVLLVEATTGLVLDILENVLG